MSNFGTDPENGRNRYFAPENSVSEPRPEDSAPVGGAYAPRPFSYAPAGSRQEYFRDGREAPDASGGAYTQQETYGAPGPAEEEVSRRYFPEGADAPYPEEEYVNSRSDAGRRHRGTAVRQLIRYAAGRDEDEAAEEEEKEEKHRTIFKKRRRKPSFVLAVIVNSLRLLLLVILLAGLSGAGAVIGIAKAYVDSAPELDLAVLDNQAQTSFIYDAGGSLICDYKGTENRVNVSISAVPLQLRYAFVAVEDARFYSHNGVDIKRIIGAFVTNLTTGSNQGGSTITQQLIKNTLLSSEQSYKRKIQEAYLAMQLENKYSKDQILECYLNTIYLGENYYGIQTAAYGYFGKNDLSTLSLRECAMLAGMTRSPYYYNCRRNYYQRTSETTDYRAITDNRTDYVLRCMYEGDFISFEEYQAALDRNSAHVLETSPEGNDLYKYPHYVEYAIKDVIKALLELNRLEDTSQNRNKMENELRTGGYHVWLAVDTEIQTAVEETLSGYGDYPALRDPSDSVYRARNSDGTYDEIVQPQAAAVVMDYRTGEVKAIVGSRTKPTQKKTLNRATDMNMPVGSAIKPIGVYAPAIELGAGDASVVYNMPLPITGWKNDAGEYSWPTNYGGSSYRGPETLRTALVNSDNTAAAYALMHLVEEGGNGRVDHSVYFLNMLGVSSAHINATPFGVSLGSSGITPYEMAVAYSCLGNGGVYQSPITFLGIFKENEQGARVNIWDSHQKQTTRQVFSPSTAWLVVDMMKEAVKSGTGTSAKIKGQTVAGKTGTNSDQKGVFFAGLTGWYCGTVWIGHDNYKSLSSKTTGGNSAAKLWKTFMERVHKEKGLEDRDILTGGYQAYGLVKVTTCSVSGLLATDACKHDILGYKTVTGYWRAGTEPTAYCPMHRSVLLCEDSDRVAAAGCPDTREAGVIVIPPDNPLYAFIGTQYSGVLSDYLGDFSLLRMTGDRNEDQRIIDANVCMLHSGTASYRAESQAARNAQDLVAYASARLAGMDPGVWGYGELVQTVTELEALLASSASDEALFNAMTRVTQALAAAETGSAWN